MEGGDSGSSDMERIVEHEEERLVEVELEAFTQLRLVLGVCLVIATSPATSLQHPIPTALLSQHPVPHCLVIATCYRNINDT